MEFEKAKLKNKKIFRKNVKKLLRDFEYSKTQNAKKLLSTEARPKFLTTDC